MTTQIEQFKAQPFNELMSIAQAFAESGMFSDTKLAAQAVVKIQAGQEMGIPPFQAMSGIHIIQGKPTVGAGLMASKVKGSGKYDYKVVEQSDKKCSIDFYQGKDMIGNSTFTIEEARKAATKNLDKFPKNMLFARAISNGVKWYCPDVFTGPVYVPEEMPEPQTFDTSYEEVNDTPQSNDSANESENPETALIDTLQSASSLDDLAKTWKSLTPAQKKIPSVLKAKDDRKAELSVEAEA